MSRIKSDRRAALSLIAAGGVASIAIPSKWSKPIINGLILPAHAQTSASMLSINGFSMDAETFTEFTVDMSAEYYQIDDISDGIASPKIISVPQPAQGNPKTFKLQRSVFEQMGLDTSTTVQVNVEIGLARFVHYIDDALGTITTRNVPANVASELISRSGERWEVSYDVSKVGTAELVIDAFVFIKV